MRISAFQVAFLVLCKILLNLGLIDKCPLSLMQVGWYTHSCCGPCSLSDSSSFTSSTISGILLSICGPG